MTTRRHAPRRFARTALAVLTGASISLLIADTSMANSPDKAVEPAGIDGDAAPLELPAPDPIEPVEISDPGPDTEALREVIGQRGDRRVNSLAVALFGDQSEALWPMQVGVEVASATGEVVVPLHDVVVSDGQRTVFSEVIEAPRGSHAFDLSIVARHHIGDAIELEYDLDVRQARFESLNWGNYLLHRLALAPRPAVGDDALAAARADIVEIQERPNQPAHRQSITVDGERYEIRLYAETLRG